ncbi:MAG: type 1 glutamine amidotransferase, partial [Deltaproteobacteria bacterium]|nr:type 1 glutamine amidotransferase [Deltaproteobacteria bacterium]
MTILFIQHVRNEGPGIFKEVLDEMGVSSHILEIFSDKNFFLPTDCRGVIILGGPMNVDDEPKYPFLKEEKEFINDILKKEMPLLGICLGAQLIAQVAGGRVFRATEKEIGWYPIRLTGKGEQDPL